MSTVFANVIRSRGWEPLQFQLGIAHARLSKQHLGEFAASGIYSELFSKESGVLFAGKAAVEIIEVTKLKEEMGLKTVAIDAFEGNNLVLVDEGHRGASSSVEGAWMSARNRLCENGFSFEYSATFGQAMKGKKGLESIYAKNILFDYSYKYFYRDGLGKDYRILNLADDSDEERRRLYLTACLVAFYQQQKTLRRQPEHVPALPAGEAFVGVCRWQRQRRSDPEQTKSVPT